MMATQKGGQFSSLTQGLEGLPPQSGPFLPSPLLLNGVGGLRSLGLPLGPSHTAVHLPGLGADDGRLLGVYGERTILLPSDPGCSLPTFDSRPSLHGLVKEGN